VGRLNGKVCLVTGANSGIGAKTCELFAEEGAKVIMLDLRDEAMQKAADGIVANGGEALAILADITDNDAVKAAVAAGVEKFGQIDALANVAGILDASMRPIEDFLTTDLDAALSVNVKGTMYVTRAVVKRFMEQGHGTIATVASIGGVTGNGSAAYTASKGALIAMTKHVALRFSGGDTKIRANCVCPGTVMTPMAIRAMKARSSYTKGAKAMQAATAKHSTLDVGTCSDLDVAKILLFLCSDESAPITGQSINADYGANL
jgi:NAD(P)-dependent dehydrogenase (short-subunit alcohol dehydrogenase family)